MRLRSEESIQAHKDRFPYLMYDAASQRSWMPSAPGAKRSARKRSWGFSDAVFGSPGAQKAQIRALKCR